MTAGQFIKVLKKYPKNSVIVEYTNGYFSVARKALNINVKHIENFQLTEVSKKKFKIVNRHKLKNVIILN